MSRPDLRKRATALAVAPVLGLVLRKSSIEAGSKMSEGSLGASLYPSPEAGCWEMARASRGAGCQGVAVTVVVPRVRNAI